MSDTRTDDKDYYRLHLRIPRQDTEVVSWIKSQRNISLAMRLLIKAYVHSDLPTDITICSVDQLRFGNNDQPSFVDSPQARSQPSSPQMPSDKPRTQAVEPKKLSTKRRSDKHGDIMGIMDSHMNKDN